MQSNRGGARIGQRRKPIAKDGELTKARPVRMTDEEGRSASDSAGQHGAGEDQGGP